MEITEPNIPKSTLSFNIIGLTNNWVETIDGATVTLSHISEDDSVITGTTVLVTINGETNEVIIDSASTDISSLLPSNHLGELSIQAEFEGDVAHLECETETKFYVGYELIATPKYSKIGVGDTAIVEVQLSKYDKTPVANKTVKLNR